jgi:hypothetical protein
MSRTLKKRGVAIVAALGTAATLALVGLGVFAGAGAAASSAAPVNTSPPTISGTAQTGHTLTGDQGKWSGKPTAYAYAWLRCNKGGNSCANIAGAQSTTYVVAAADIGNTLRFKVDAKNADGTTSATSAATAVVTTGTKPPPATGCPAGSAPVQVSQVTPPARLLIDQQQSDPSVVHRGTQQIVLRYHVSDSCGQSVQGALVYATAVPFNQLDIPAEQTTDKDGWTSLTFHALAGFPVSNNQQLIAVFVRARKSGENLLGGISTRRLFSVPVSL